MRKLFLTGLTGTLLAAAVLAGPGAAAKPSQLIVAMRDPGCHWFYLGGGPDKRQYSKTVIRRAPVALVNLDEAALIIKGPGGTKTEAVGARLKLRAKGVYKIRMVHQESHDNILKLTIK